MNISRLVSIIFLYMQVDSKMRSLKVWDTKGHPGYDNLRPLSYPHTVMEATES